MKILLLGEFSGLHNNLKEGLLEHGHEVLVAGDGDGFKKLPVDILLKSNYKGVIGKLGDRFKTLSKVQTFEKYDVVQLINAFVFYKKFFPYKKTTKRIFNSNKKVYLLAAGDDAYFWKYGRKNLKYGPFDDYLKYDLKANRSYLETQKAFDFNDMVVNCSNGVIPVMYEYEKSYQNCSKRLNTIPIPVNTRKIQYIENLVKNKLVVFHGLNRYGFKGTRYVEEAFKQLKKKYPNDLELIIDGKMPLCEYLSIMRRANIIIDQLNSHSLGVNGIYAMAMGKIVFGGAEPESLESLGVEFTPAINLTPSVSSIIEKVEYILEERKNIKEMGYKSRQFIEQTHCHIKIAKKYLATWNK